MTTTSPLPDQLIYLIIRFTASIPDLELPIPSPRTVTTVSLKQLIRSHLPLPHTYARLRLIYAGKVLPDTAPLSLSLKLPPPPPPRNGTYNEHGPGSKSKGKQPIRDGAVDEDLGQAQYGGARRFYIHCSLGDALSAKELHSEAAQARASEVTLQAEQEREQATSGTSEQATSGDASEHTDADGRARRRSSTTTAPPPQGFDRLLSSGFTPAEVAALRSQFQTNLSFTHTPDTMPSAAELRRLEDRWLDSTAMEPSPSDANADVAGGGGTEGWGAGFGIEDGGLDDMLWGYLVGFFWPLGGLVWGFREEGVWSRRRQVAVVMGVVLNAAFGFMRWSS